MKCYKCTKWEEQETSKVRVSDTLILLVKLILTKNSRSLKIKEIAYWLESAQMNKKEIKYEKSRFKILWYNSITS